MKNNKGFTLIELLAVIVILAIIALIAVPIVVNIINDSKKESLKRSAEIYIDAVEKRIVKENLKIKFDPQYCEGESGEELTCYDRNNNSLGKIDIEIKNKVPKNIKLYFNNGEVLKDETLELELEGYFISANTKGEVVLKKSAEESKKCVLYSDVLDVENLSQSEYVDYTGYTEYTNGMDIPTAYAAQDMTFTPATFNTTKKKWIVGDTGDGHGAYYTIQESGYYQIIVENGRMMYVMKAQDEKIVNTYMNNEELEHIQNTSSEIEYLEQGDKILIMNSTPNSNFYIRKSNTNTTKKECIKWRTKYKKGTEEITSTNDYRGYYADINADGYVDGIIYADLAHSESGEWTESGGAYSYTAQTGLKEYTISSDTYKENDGFGEQKVITLKPGSTGNSRFHVMALENYKEGSFEAGSGYKEGTYYWYNNAYNNMNPIITSKDFGEGKENTRKMIAKWNAAGTSEGYANSPQDYHDIWKHIQEEYGKGWYIPSRGEWSAFGDYFTNNPRVETKLTTSNYIDIYGLSYWYWASSQNNASDAWGTSFINGYMFNSTVNANFYVRLGVTF